METSTTVQPADPAAEKVRFQGATIDVGDRVLIVPPLNARSAKELSPKFAQLEGIKADNLSTSAWLDLVIDIALPAVVRNYPTLTREELEELVDMGNANDFFMAAIGKFVTRVRPAVQ